MPVHPHVCGEHSSSYHGNAPLDGSSPRVWGTSHIRVEQRRLSRFIPTCVGNIDCQACRSRELPVHPHVCGEHADFREFAFCYTGSSPRVWGTFLFVDSVCHFIRFIPTCVGNMFTLAMSSLLISGSSPRVWGTYCQPCCRVWSRRFIPTCVGNITF